MRFDEDACFGGRAFAPILVAKITQRLLAGSAFFAIFRSLVVALASLPLQCLLDALFWLPFGSLSGPFGVLLAPLWLPFGSLWVPFATLFEPLGGLLMSSAPFRSLPLRFGSSGTTCLGVDSKLSPA